ncbi:MAG: DUF2490 domain-containing protein [Bryobacteraceae bacterium]|nr:DUF2490 domain-containing protein [Bryobacteraceae bacterium]MDW8377687.1 DUF2490 domain-containing protein [Bryobacterales bacterium]
MYFGDHPWRSQSRWGLHLEGQWRRHDVLPRAQQLLLRPALNYEVSRNLILTGGYAWVSTHRYGQFPVQVPFPEHRLWQQLLLKHAAGKVQLSHRYRLEQRFLGEPVARAEGTRHLERYRYENRFRYMLRALVPLKGKYALALFDEWMVNFGRNVASNVFDQNRAYVALAYQLPRSSRLELGYMHQLIQQRNGKVFENNHTFVVGIHSTFSLSKQN